MIEKQRKYLPGSEWIYLKLYTGPKAADTILTEHLLPLTEALLEEQIIDKWFFIRYADPEHHVRFRMRVTGQENLGEALLRAHDVISTCSENGTLWNVISDTYSRELERYVPKAYDAMETYFGLESQMIAKSIAMLEGDEGEELRWLFSLKAIDILLSDFEYTEDEKMLLLEKLKSSFAQEFNTNKQLQKQLDTKYRTYKVKVLHFLSSTENNAEVKPLLDLIFVKSTASAKCISEISTLLEVERRDSVLGSMIHMFMNRIFRSKNRLHEMVLYDMLYRHYKAAWGKRTYVRKAMSA